VKCLSLVLRCLWVCINLLIIMVVSLFQLWLGLAVISVIILLCLPELEEAPQPFVIFFCGFVILYLLAILWWNLISFRDRWREVICPEKTS